MPKYDMLCENCGIIEIEHSIHEDHPELHECEENHLGVVTCGKMTRAFNREKAPVIRFISSRGGGVDDWASKVAKGPENPTSEETGVAYR